MRAVYYDGFRVYQVDAGSWPHHPTLGTLDKHNRTLNSTSDLEPNRPIDFEYLTARFTLDTASESLFGHNLGTLAHLDDGLDGFMEAFVKIRQLSIHRSIAGGPWPHFEYFGDKCKRHEDATMVGSLLWLSVRWNASTGCPRKKTENQERPVDFLGAPYL